MTLKNIAIVVEAAVAGAGLLTALFSFIRSRLTTKTEKGLRSVLLAVPRAILEAEACFLDGHGDEKKRFAIVLLKEYCNAVGIQYSHYQELIESAIEDTLCAPQKKGDFYEEKNEQQKD